MNKGLADKKIVNAKGGSKAGAPPTKKSEIETPSGASFHPVFHHLPHIARTPRFETEWVLMYVCSSRAILRTQRSLVA